MVIGPSSVQLCFQTDQFVEQADHLETRFKQTDYWWSRRSLSSSSGISAIGILSLQHLRLICRSCTELCHLSLTDCPSITDICMKAVGGLKHLRVLNLADCLLVSDLGIKYLTDGACTARLRELNLTNCMRISDSSMNNITRRCKRIAYLKLCYLDEVSETGLEFLGQLDNLTSIDLTGTQTSDVSLKTLGHSGQLHSVTLSSCRLITDLGLTKFATSCTHLEHLNLSFCTQLTDNAIRSMAFCCKYLTTLNVCSCPLLTDMSLQYLSGVCKYLYEIDISYCPLITDKGTKYLRRNCQYLKRVILIECPNISRAAIDKLQLSVPHVQFQFLEQTANWYERLLSLLHQSILSHTRVLERKKTLLLWPSIGIKRKGLDIRPRASRFMQIDFNFIVGLIEEERGVANTQ